MQHTTVLLHEAVDGLALSPDATVVDATFGGGGHAREILKRLGAHGTYIGIDADASALRGVTFDDVPASVHLVHENFSQIAALTRTLQITSVDAILADLGWRMEQFATGEKGFSFQHDGPLHMTFGDPQEYAFTADDIINEWDEHVIADILYGYADERFARRIAKAIVAHRRHSRIRSTLQLAEVVTGALPKAARYGKTNPATKTFQALRIAVNNELGVLETFIKDGVSLLTPGGRMAIITFHSIEDRVVKHAFRELKEAGVATPETKKPLIPSSQERSQNARSRSAKLRIITKREE
jgi:16S rRNA (cytosine1402-N4)-methyltransferase